MMKNSKIILSCLVSIMLATSASAAWVPLTGNPVPISSLPDRTLIFGDKKLSEIYLFGSATGGAIKPDANSLFVQGGQDDTTGNYGLWFLLSWNAFSGQTINATLNFKISVLPGYDNFIKDVEMYITGSSATGTGGVNIGETVWDAPFPGGNIIASLSCSKQANDGGAYLVDYAEFTPLKEIWIFSKDISITGGTDPGGSGHLSGFLQFYSQVPEPTTMALLGLGFVALLRKRRILTKSKPLFICLLVLPLLSISAYAGSPVDVNFLGTAASFGVLGGSTVTNVGNTVINGDLGVWSGTSITGFGPGIVNGTIYAGGAVAQQAQSDVTAAYLSLAGMLYDQDLSTYVLGSPGYDLLTPGVYKFTSSAQLTGHLTLDVQHNPNSLFVFQIGTTLTTAPGSSVTMINVPDEGFCNKYWQVDTAILGSGTAFMGNILALTSITLDGGTLNGRALARNGAVTISAATITTPCVIPEPTTLILLGTAGIWIFTRKKHQFLGGYRSK